jgi:hypothetical protein
MYGKFYESTFTGSMVGSGSHVFAVWGYVIANTKQDSLVELNPVLIAAAIGEETDRVEKAIEYLQSDDPKSRSKEHNGKRLVKKGEFLYFVPQAAKYRGLPNDRARKEYMAQKQREHRERVASCQTDMSKSVIQAEAEAIRIKQKKSTPIIPLKGDVDVIFKEWGIEKEADGFFDYYSSNGWKVGKNPMKDWKAAARNWRRNNQKHRNNQAVMTKYELPLPKGCSIRRDGEVLDYTGRVMDINQVRSAARK